MKMLRSLGEAFIFPLQATAIIILLCSPLFTIFALCAWVLHLAFGVDVMACLR